MGIQLTQAKYDAIMDILNGVTPRTELECTIEPFSNMSRKGRKIQNSQFKRIVAYAKNAFSTHSIVTEEPVLDIMSKLPSDTNVTNSRVSLVGMQNILHFCNTGSIIRDNIGASIHLMKKQRVSKVLVEDYGIAFKESIETLYKYNVDKKKMMMMIMDVVRAQHKTMRLKQRYSLVLDEFLRLDFTAVKSTWDARLIKEGASNLKTEYEVELECIQPSLMQVKDRTQLLSNMIAVMSELLKVIDDVDYLIGYKASLDVVSSYLALAFGDQKYDISKVLAYPRKYFAGPQPVTLELKHLLPVHMYPVSILNNYTVTMKADGERHLVFVDDIGHIYLINSRLNIVDTGMVVSTLKSCLLDAEVMKHSNGSKSVLLFDAYFMNNDPVHTYPLVAKLNQKSRLAEMQRFETLVHESTSVFPDDTTMYSFKAKEFKYPVNQKMPKTIFDSVKDVFYDISMKRYGDVEDDGLIFTPANLPVMGNEHGVSAEKLGGTWASVLKWKPPLFNTIDFLIRKVGTILRDGEEYHRYNLFCSRSVNHYDTSYAFLTRNDQPAHGKGVYDNEYIPWLFDAQYPLLVNGDVIDVSFSDVKVINGKAVASNGDEIIDQNIVEFSFDRSVHKWIPLRVRHDKTEQYVVTGKIRETANNYAIALSVWQSILEPVTQCHIEGLTEVRPENIDLNEAYYVREKTRNESLTLPMKEFHNKWVKGHSLIKRFKGILKSVMDTGCGQGGDMFKYIDAEFSTMLGMDLSKSNIYNSMEGANQRLLKAIERKQIPKHWRYVFIPMDLSKDIREQIMDDSVSKDVNNDNKLKRILWGYDKSNNAKLNAYEGMALKQFELVSCQFVLHFFFRDKNALNNYLNTLTQHLRPGGYFIGTCFDATKVERMLEGTGVAEGYKENKLIWRIRKKYNESVFDYFGTRIGVYVETISNDENDEFLVNFDFLVEELKKRNIRLLTETESQKLGLSRNQSHGSFKELYDDMLVYGKSPKASDTKWLQTAEKMCDDEKRLSFLYKWFVFRKDEKVL